MRLYYIITESLAGFLESICGYLYHKISDVKNNIAHDKYMHGIPGLEIKSVEFPVYYSEERESIRH